MTKTFAALIACAASAAMALGAEPSATSAAADKPKPSTLDTCIVSGEKLGSMGEGVKVVYGGREVTLCCKGCIKTFNKDPAGYIAKVEAAEKAKAAAKTTSETPAKPDTAR